MERVILGMPGPWATDFYEASDHYTTKIGGLPDWPIPREDIKPDLLQCAVCRGYLSLVAQVYAPLESGTLKVEERVIYVLGCPSPKCGSNSLSWRTLRFQKFSTMVESSESNYANSQSGQVVLSSASQKVAEFPASSGPVLTNDDWWEEDSWTHGYGEDLDHERNGAFSLQELGRAFSEAARQISRTGKQNGHAHHASVEDYSSKPSMRVIDASIPVAPCFYIYSQEELSLRDSSAVCGTCPSSSIKESKMLLETCGGEETWEEEGYEYDRALNADRVYLKFKKRLETYPEQCFRYSFGGKPLLASKDVGKPGSCGLCGGPRHYEMQLMPPLLYFLQQAADSLSTYSPGEWNWMTLVVYTCSKSCSLRRDEDGSGGSPWLVAEEATIVQHE